MTVWEFDVAVSTHDLMRRGIVVADYRRVHVAADTYAEASMVAIQLASGPDDVTATDILWRY